MSIASRTTSIEGHIQDDYKSLQRLGADLTNVDKNIENIASVADDIYDKLPKVTDTGSNVSLTPTLQGALGIVPLGNCEQDSTTGKNLIDIPSTASKNNVTLTKNSDGTFNISINGSASANSDFNAYIETTLSSGTYTLSKSYASSNLQVFIQDYNDTTWLSNLLVLNTSSTSVTQSITPTGNRIGITIRVTSGSTFNENNIKVQLESGSNVTNFEPYTGGIPSPNPSYPQDIKVVTGNNSVVISNANLWDEETQLGFYNDSGKWTSRNDILSSKNPIYVDSSKSYYFNAPSQIFYTQWTSNETFISRTTLSNGKGILNLDNNCAYIYFNLLSAYGTTYNNDIIVSVGTSAIPYVAHQEQTCTLNLGTEYLAGIDTYKDKIVGTKDNWKIVRNIGKITFVGIENWQRSTNYTNTTVYYLEHGLSNIVADPFLSNYFTFMLGNDDTPHIRWGGTGNSRFLIFSPILNNVDSFKTWLSSNNTTIYYPLATPTEETITNTALIEQLNAIYELMGYDGTTNISITSAEGNAQMLVEATALKGE